MSAAPDDGAARAYGYAPPAAGSARRAELDRLLDLAVRDTGAHLIDHARRTAPRTDDIALLLIRLGTAG
ncbi:MULTISPECIES: hypothetical protein [unclassified Streptomyces]|uniref:hypothetical protein n=1 Tax=unclassified Streptomyces TaxID=2593676 RepID=UPI002E820418|nr:hypothetical protein [Streptomyces sp. NBC_00562]WUC17833.1 hypothetical protein OHA33_02465 [Streptomyces sp. NBC_00562]